MVVYPIYYLGSGGGTDRRSGSKHENVLSTVCVFQRCSAFPCAITADEDILTRTSANYSGKYAAVTPELTCIASR